MPYAIRPGTVSEACNGLEKIKTFILQMREIISLLIITEIFKFLKLHSKFFLFYVLINFDYLCHLQSLVNGIVVTVLKIVASCCQRLNVNPISQGKEGCFPEKVKGKYRCS